MAETSYGKDRILAMHERFEKALNGQASTPLHTLRRDALDRFVQLGLPTTRDEEWRYTNLAPIQGLDFQPSLRADGTPLSAAALAPYLLGGLTASRLVFVDGIYSPALSDLGPMPHGARICGLAEALGRDSRTLEPYLNQGVRYEGHAFSALNTAFLRDGAFVHLPKGTVVREPIHLLFVSTGT
jgi:Fe-S cluster assembly protein SufD